MATFSSNTATPGGSIAWRNEQPQLLYDYGESGEYAAHEGQGFSLVSVIVGVFVLLALTLSPVPTLNIIPKIFGVVLLLAYVGHMYNRRLRACPETKIYLAWAIWAALGGVWMASEAEQFFFKEKLQTVFQIWLMMLIVSGFVRSKRALSFVLLMFLIGATIVGGYSWITGEFTRVATSLRGDQRVSGLAGNANSFAILLIFATACMAYFWMRPSRALWARWVKRGLIVPSAAMVMYAVILSGSRKGALGLALFYVLWLFFCYRRELVRKPALLVTVIIMTALATVFVWGYVQTSTLGERMNRSIEGYRDSGIEGGLGDARSGLYRAAGRLVSENPIAGVGLDCFRLRSGMGAPAHSEYLEIAADTGIVGAAIYFSWYIVLWIRLGKIRKWSKYRDIVDWRISGLVRAMLLVMLALNFGSWFYTSKSAFLFMGCFMGYSMMAMQSIRNTQQAEAI